MRNFFAPCPAPSCFEGRVPIFSPPGTKMWANNETKTHTKKIANKPAAKSCAEAAFCKGDPAPRASLRTKLLPAKLKCKVLSLKNNPWKAVQKHVPVARWAQCLKCEKVKCNSYSGPNQIALNSNWFSNFVVAFFGFRFWIGNQFLAQVATKMFLRPFKKISK